MNSNRRNLFVASCFFLSFLVLVVISLQLLDVPLSFSKFYRNEDVHDEIFFHLFSKSTQDLNLQMILPKAPRTKYPQLRYNKQDVERANLNSPLIFQIPAPTSISQTNFACSDVQKSPFENPRLHKRSSRRMEMELSVNKYSEYMLDFNTLKKRFTKYKTTELNPAILNGRLNTVVDGPYNPAVFSPDPSVPVGDGLLLLIVMSILYSVFKFRKHLFLVLFLFRS